MKKLLFLIVIVLIALAAWGGVEIFLYKTDKSIGTDVLVRGEVVSVDLSSMYVDGDGIVVVNTEDGIKRKVSVPAGETPCPADIDDFYTHWNDLKAGDRVEALGEKISRNAVRPCVSEVHYFKVVQ